jgi:hypothetical protein
VVGNGWGDDAEYALGSNYPYAVLVNVGITDLEDLREKAREASRKWACDHRVKVKNKAVLFCFDNRGAAFVFEGYCKHNHIPCRRIED